MKFYVDYEFMRNKAVFILISSLSFLNAYIMCVGEHLFLWSSEDNLNESVLCLHHVGPKDQTHSSGFGS